MTLFMTNEQNLESVTSLAFVSRRFSYLCILERQQSLKCLPILPQKDWYSEQNLEYVSSPGVYKSYSSKYNLFVEDMIHRMLNMHAFSSFNGCILKFISLCRHI